MQQPEVLPRTSAPDPEPMQVQQQQQQQARQQPQDQQQCQQLGRACTSLDGQPLLTGRLSMPPHVFQDLMGTKGSQIISSWTGGLPVHAIIMSQGQVLQDLPGAQLCWISCEGGRSCHIAGVNLGQRCMGAAIVCWELRDAGSYPWQPNSAVVRPAVIVVHVVRPAPLFAASHAVEQPTAPPLQIVQPCVLQELPSNSRLVDKAHTAERGGHKHASQADHGHGAQHMPAGHLAPPSSSLKCTIMVRFACIR